MKMQQIKKQNRVMELTKMALRGASMTQLMTRCDQMDVCQATKYKYIEEVQDNIKKGHENKMNNIISCPKGCQIKEKHHHYRYGLDDYLGRYLK